MHCASSSSSVFSEDIARYNFNLGVYFVADPSLVNSQYSFEEVIMQALKGGVSMIQLRDKSENKDQIYRHAKEIQEILSLHKKRQPQSSSFSSVRFVINDHVDIAKDIQCDGVHIGQEDMCAKQARAFLGEDAIIGLTAFTKEQIKKVDSRVIDYIGVGPFYETKTKKGKPVLGAQAFKELVSLSCVPVVGIGGIEPGNAYAVIKSGAKGVAMMRSISCSEDPQSSASSFCKVVKAAL